MKKFAVLAATLAVTLAWTITAFAGKCPVLMKQIDDKVAMASLSAEDAKKVKALRKDGEFHHKKGEHNKSVPTLKKALGILGG